MKNIQYVNNTCQDISMLGAMFAEAYKTGCLHDDFDGIFFVKILKGYNPDGTDRMIIDMAND